MKPKHKICDVCDPYENQGHIFKMKRIYWRENKPKNRYDYTRKFDPIGWICWKCGHMELDLEILAEIRVEKEKKNSKLGGFT